MSDLVKAQSHKDAGNEFVKQGEWRKASYAYKQAFLFLGGYSSTSPMMGIIDTPSQRSEEEDALVAALKVVCFSNLALCALRLNRPDDAIRFSQGALELHPNHPKASIRLAQGYAMGGFLSNAKEALDSVVAKGLVPVDDPLVIRLRKEIAPDEKSLAKLGSAMRSIIRSEE